MPDERHSGSSPFPLGRSCETAMTDLPRQNDIPIPGATARIAAIRIAAVLSRPRAVGLLCIVLLAAAGWLYLGVSAGISARAGDSWLAVLCRPAFTQAGSLWSDLLLAFPMWIAMTLAMMLPSAGPMVLTYSEIAETAWRKGERVVSPLILSTGYLTIWFGFAIVAAFAQAGLGQAAQALEPAMALSGFAMPATAALFLVAGAYQFSALKSACLSACQRPFSFFFMNWTDRGWGVFQLGLHQGLHCLGCCWALMLLMFGTGAMNIAWMAALGAIMLCEKLSPTAWFSKAVGWALMLSGIVLGIAWAAGLSIVQGG
jgi:predicted metal-binding membrane protein